MLWPTLGVRESSPPTPGVVASCLPAGSPRRWATVRGRVASCGVASWRGAAAYCYYLLVHWGWGPAGLGVGSGWVLWCGRGCTSRVFCDRGRASGRPCCPQHLYDSAAPLGVLSLSYLPLSRLAAAAGGLRFVWVCGSTLAVEFAFTVVGWHYSWITFCELYS